MSTPASSPEWPGHVVLVGHRAAGKSRLLATVARRLGRPAVDLDALIAEREGLPVRALFERSQAAFRAAERRAFASISGRAVIAAGGGFLSHHADLLEGHTAVLVPVDFETYRARMLEDVTRPRLRPELPIEEEIAEVFAEREALHARVTTVPLDEVLRAGDVRSRRAPAIRVVTLPRGADAIAFARRARALGADALEIRDDLVDRFDAAALAKVLPLLLAHRGGSGFTAEARRLARWEDSDLGPIVSRHFATPLAPGDAEAFWASRGAQLIKHVEPEPGPRLLETQRRLIARFGEGRVTVLGVGPCALPWRAVLAQRNAFDYLALDEASASAAGQRLLADAVRADSAGGPRLAIIGHRISGSRSPRIHQQPFDRWDLPPDAPVAELVEQLREHYRGFAITSPLKRSFRVGDPGSVFSHLSEEKAAGMAINTLVRSTDGWLAANTDVDGARAVLERYRVGAFTALGDGGVTWALRAAARGSVTVVKARDARPVTGDVFWTWPEHLPTPARLRLDGARVFIIVYGAAAKRPAARIVELGGTPVRAGATWFVAQARAQRRLWDQVTSSTRSDPSPCPSPRLGRGDSL